MLTRPRFTFLYPEYLTQVALPEVQRGAQIIRICAALMVALTVAFALGLAWVYAH